MNDRYIDLIIAIIDQAKRDYTEALRHIDSKSPKVQARAQKMKRDCERFFMSEWGQALTIGNGELLIEQCRKEAARKEPSIQKRRFLNG